MTPKQKAKELIYKFEGTGIDIYDATQVNLIAINEIMEQLDEVRNITGSSYVLRIIDYWQEVKLETENL